MNNRIKIFFGALLIALVFSSNLQAQDKQLSKEQKTEMLKQYKENHSRLKLTDEQQQPYKTIVKKYVVKMRKIKEATFDNQLPSDSLKVLTVAKNAEMKALLSAEQYQTYLEIQHERKEKLLESTQKKL